METINALPQSPDDIAEDFRDSFNQTLPDRACGSCDLCCKVFRIEELRKPPGELCVHAAAGKGCAIHPERPGTCRAFFCGWRVDPNLPPDWKPETSGFIISVAREFASVFITVDPDRPEAWKRAPYYPLLKQWGGRAIMDNKRLVVVLKGEATIILPDIDQPIGRLESGHRIDLYRDGKHLRARFVRAA